MKLKRIFNISWFPFRIFHNSCTIPHHSFHFVYITTIRYVRYHNPIRQKAFAFETRQEMPPQAWNPTMLNPTSNPTSLNPTKFKFEWTSNSETDVEQKSSCRESQQVWRFKNYCNEIFFWIVAIIMFKMIYIIWDATYNNIKGDDRFLESSITISTFTHLYSHNWHLLP